MASNASRAYERIQDPPHPPFYSQTVWSRLLLLRLQIFPIARTRCTVLHKHTLCPCMPDMKLSYIPTFLLCFLLPLTFAHSSPPSTAGSPRGTCIQDNEVQGIAQRWLNAFATGGLHTLDSAVTENVRPEKK